jgi:hypothetical protein
MSVARVAHILVLLLAAGHAAARVRLDDGPLPLAPAPSPVPAPVPMKMRCFLWIFDCDDDDKSGSGGINTGAAAASTNTNTNTLSVTVAAAPVVKPSPTPEPTPSPSPPPEACATTLVQLRCPCSRECRADVSYVLAGVEASCIRPYCSTGASADGDTCDARYVVKPGACVPLTISDSHPLYIDGAEVHPQDGGVVDLHCPCEGGC